MISLLLVVIPGWSSEKVSVASTHSSAILDLKLYLKYISQERISLLPPGSYRLLSTQNHFLLNFCLRILLGYLDRVKYGLQTHVNSGLWLKVIRCVCFYFFLLFFVAFRAKSKIAKSALQC